jgi:hypothetical protein
MLADLWYLLFVMYEGIDAYSRQDGSIERREGESKTEGEREMGQWEGDFMCLVNHESPV